MRATILTFIVFVVWSCHAELAMGDTAAKDPYIPAQSVVSDGVPAYRFTDDQLARMARTKLDEKRFVAYLEQRWTPERLRAYCVEANIRERDQQNLVAFNCTVKADLHKGVAHGFDRIHVYVSDDTRQVTYRSGLEKNFSRWTYSLNVILGERHWVIIEALPNDFMDSAQYDPK